MPTLVRLVESRHPTQLYFVSGVVAPSRFAFLDTQLPGSRRIVQSPRRAVKPAANLLGISVVRSTWIPTDTGVDRLLASAPID